MGNLGKRLLIITLSVALVVAIALVGNAFQQRDKAHNLSSEKSVVYSGSYNGVSYEVTKKDVWNNILYSSPMTTITENLDKYLLSSYIDSVTDETKIQEKLNYLIYGTTDAEKIQDYKDDAKNNEKLLLTFRNKMNVLGYFDDNEHEHTYKDYAKLMIAYDLYATYRLENNLKIGTLEPELDNETLKDLYAEKAQDAFAVTIKFFSEDEAKEFYKEFKVALVSSKLRMYIGDSDYVVAKNDDGSYYLNDDLTPVYYTQTVTKSDSTTSEEKVPNGNVVKNSDGTYEWDSTTDSWVYTNGTFVSSKVAYEDVTSFTTSNTAVLSANNWMNLYVAMYNKFYAQYRESLPTVVDKDAFFTAFGFDKDAEGFISDANASTLNEVLKKYNLALVTWTDSNDAKHQEIRKYVGNESYVVLVQDGVAQGKEGYPTYKKLDGEDIPNYKIEVDENGEPVLDYEGHFIYYLDENGKQQISDSKKKITDEGVVVDLSNSIEANLIQLYGAYFNMFEDYANDNWNVDYKRKMEKIADKIYYSFEDLNSAREDLAKEIFATLPFDKSSTTGYFMKATSMNGAVSSETPYYLVLKLTNTTNENPTDEEISEYKKELIEDYLLEEGLTEMAMAELRAEAGLTVYDEFFKYEYESSISQSDSSNKYGVSESDGYITYKSYKARKVAALTKEVTVNGNKVSKKVLTADDVYNYAMSYSGPSYIATTALNKVLLKLAEFETIHGKEKNYLTSKNWKMQAYASTAEQYNYYYEYYKQMYAQYGYEFYDSVDQFLFSYGARSFDDLVTSLKRSTMRNIFLYNALVNDAFFNNSNDAYNATLSAYATTTLDPTSAQSGKPFIFKSDEFTKIYDEYYDINASHVLIYVDYDEDGTPDDYNKFLETFDSTTNESSFLKKEDGVTPLTLSDWNQAIAQIENKLREFIYTDDSWSSSKVSDLANFITEYNKSCRIDGDYKDYKKLGIALEYESLGEVTNLTEDNFVEEFGVALREIKEKLERVDNDLLGYSLGDKLYKTEFGMHFIVETAGTNYDKPDFSFIEDDAYPSELINQDKKVTDAQLAIYILEYAYNNIFGSTDNPEEHAGFEYPNIPSELKKAFTTYYDSFMSTVLDKSSTYHSNFIMLLSLSSEESSYKNDFKNLLDIYYSVLFGALA